MVRRDIYYVCGQCGFEAGKWLGKCPACNAWNSMTEDVRNLDKKGKAIKYDSLASQVFPLTAISQDEVSRHSTGNSELDRVLGGGIVPGSLVLLGGDPGVGKSTLLLQVAGNLAQSGLKVLYISGEESLQQIKIRATRLNINGENIYLLNEQNIDYLEKQIETINPSFVIIDSIQTVYVSGVPSIPGSVAQLRESTMRLAEIAKRTHRCFFLIGHVTKEGAIAGPKLLEHMVDAVVYFEGENNMALRVLRSVKNRFGSTNEIGLMEMSNFGLREVVDPSFAFIDTYPPDISGISITPIHEGSRPFLIEIQALVSPTGPGYARRMASGIDHNRLALLIAVIEKRLGFNLNSLDVYVKVSGGFFLKDPAVDLGVSAAIISSFLDRPIPPKTVFIGEVSLSGLISKVSFLDTRLKEAEKLGFERAIIPSVSKTAANSFGMTAFCINNIKELLEIMEV